MQNATFPAFGLSWFAFNLIQIEGKPLKTGLWAGLSKHNLDAADKLKCPVTRSDPVRQTSVMTIHPLPSPSPSPARGNVPGMEHSGSEPWGSHKPSLLRTIGFSRLSASGNIPKLILSWISVNPHQIKGNPPRRAALEKTCPPASAQGLVSPGFSGYKPFVTFPFSQGTTGNYPPFSPGAADTRQVP